MSLFVPSARALHGYHYPTCESRPQVQSVARGKLVGIELCIRVRKAGRPCSRLSTFGTCFHAHNRFILHFNIFLELHFSSTPRHDNILISNGLKSCLFHPISPNYALTTCIFINIIALEGFLLTFLLHQCNFPVFNTLNSCFRIKVLT